MPSKRNRRPWPEGPTRRRAPANSTLWRKLWSAPACKCSSRPTATSPPKPDAVFPNNWVSFHHDGTVTLYPMLAPNRRWERRDEVLEQVVRQGGFRILRTVDLTHRESEDKYLEGTGSVVLDRRHRIAYASSSPRTDLDVLGEFAQQLDYDLMTFDAVDARGTAIYHTNVLMAIGTTSRSSAAPPSWIKHRAAAVPAALDRARNRRDHAGANDAIRRQCPGVDRAHRQAPGLIHDRAAQLEPGPALCPGGSGYPVPRRFPPSSAPAEAACAVCSRKFTFRSDSHSGSTSAP